MVWNKVLQWFLRASESPRRSGVGAKALHFWQFRGMTLMSLSITLNHLVLYLCGWWRWGVEISGCGYKVTFLKVLLKRNCDLIQCDLGIVTSWLLGVTICIFSYGFLFLWSGFLVIILGSEKGFPPPFFLTVYWEGKKMENLAPDCKKNRTYFLLRVNVTFSELLNPCFNLSLHCDNLVLFLVGNNYMAVAMKMLNWLTVGTLDFPV